MSLTFFTYQKINETLESLEKKIKSHNSKENVLIPEALEHYKNDVSILRLFLSGTYEKSYRAIMDTDIRAMADIAGGK